MQIITQREEPERADYAMIIDAKVRKKLGEFQLDATIRDEGLICLTGRNGSGKSTLLNIIAGILKADQGYVKLNSREVTSLPMDKRQIVLVTSESSIPHLEVSRHLVWGAKIKKVPIDDGFVARVRTSLGISYDGKLNKLSLGMKERVSIASALISKPQVILVDEAFSNIDNSEGFISSFAKLASEIGVSAIFTTQHLEDAKLANHHYAMEAGMSHKVF